MNTVELLGIIHHLLGIAVAILGLAQMSKKKEK